MVNAPRSLRPRRYSDPCLDTLDHILTELGLTAIRGVHTHTQLPVDQVIQAPPTLGHTPFPISNRRLAKVAHKHIKVCLNSLSV